MKTFTSVAVVSVLAAVAQAQTLPDIPSCALQCFLTALQADGCESVTDFKCHCAKPELVSTVTPCVEKECSPAEQQTVREQTVSVCEAAGVPIQLSSAPASSAAASTSAPASSAASSEATATETETATAEPTEEPTEEPTVAPTGTGSPSTPTNGTVTGPTVPSATYTGAASAHQVVGGALGFVAMVAAFAGL